MSEEPEYRIYVSSMSDEPVAWDIIGDEELARYIYEVKSRFPNDMIVIREVLETVKEVIIPECNKDRKSGEEMNKYQKAFPIGSEVYARDHDGEMRHGVISIHTEDRNEGNGLIVRFDDGHWFEFGYQYIDLDNPDNSYVIQAKDVHKKGKKHHG